METLLITQARTGSSRLPGKVLKTVDGKTLLQIHLERLKKCQMVNDIIVATTLEKYDEPIATMAKEWGFHTYRGSEEDVLDRFYQAAKPFKPNWIVRVTSDCPLLDPDLVDKIIEFSHQHEADYVSNNFETHFPHGQDVEVFTFKTLERAWKETNKLTEREHVTPYLRNNSDLKGGSLFKALNYPIEHNYGGIRMTIDEEEDYELIKILVQDLGSNKSWKEYADYMVNKSLTTINCQYKRNEGYLKSLEKD